ncbi:LysM peptidoglycan-binding domain-containing protein [Pseudoalteromonas sp. MMG005]|uniref:LysM peptidoglycan-binding domain-containing protein n=1 Tax=Pseudoalteromonas sp. MMG005 TaxID=2822682 RepID=UPI001B3A4AE4|nr:LysM peptidoglycan-binding domain-containing protein [Pseudoalteromonas sp. MMG005]MBQ4847147.1 LysM peptidoglycan-binding domain-containing protein [Pseudoalteromonas sp. MMG005]
MPLLYLVISLVILMLTGCAKTPYQVKHRNDTPVPTQTTKTTTLPQNKNIVTVKPQDVDDVWQRIALQLSFAPSQHSSVHQRIQWYLKHPNYMHEISRRAAPFLYYIVSEVERRNLPIELALMPLIESDFNTAAYSHKHASGLWQLTPLIAKHYGVKIGPWYDGRQDIVDATHAALDFLTYLHRRFNGNWYHAIAAYNTGEGRVARAIKNNQKQGKPSDFFSLKLPQQTRHYVPKLLAAAALLRQQEMEFPPITNQAVIDVVPLKNGVILTDASAWQSLESLNPGYTRFPALLDGPQHIVVKTADTASWHTYVAQQPLMPKQQWQQYTIVPGDSLSVIAQRHDLSVAQLKTFNQLTSSRIRAGKTLMLPILADKKIDYAVKSGDSLWRIARTFNVTVSKLMQWNSLSKETLRIGDKLTVFLAPL